MHLGFNAAWVHDQVAVDAGSHVVQHRTAVLHRSFDDVSYYRTERFVYRHAPGTAGRQLAFAIFAFVHGQLQCGPMARTFVGK
ncbi:hypothetical protein D3C75_1002900 [compost metagenome]